MTISGSFSINFIFVKHLAHIFEIINKEIVFSFIFVQNKITFTILDFPQQQARPCLFSLDTKSPKQSLVQLLRLLKPT